MVVGSSAGAHLSPGTPGNSWRTTTVSWPQRTGRSPTSPSSSPPRYRSCTGHRRSIWRGSRPPVRSAAHASPRRARRTPWRATAQASRASGCPRGTPDLASSGEASSSRGEVSSATRAGSSPDERAPAAAIDRGRRSSAHRELGGGQGAASRPRLPCTTGEEDQGRRCTIGEDE
jgi:hypothetical protein